MAAVLWRCDYCAGPAAWTIDGSDAYFSCRRQCDGFRQMELLGEVRVEALTRGGEPEEPECTQQEDISLPF